MNKNKKTFGDIDISIVEEIGPLENNAPAMIARAVITEENVEAASAFAMKIGIGRMLKENLEKYG